MNYGFASLSIILLPLACFIVLSLFGKRIKPAISGIISCFALVVSTLLAIYVAYGYFFEFGKLDNIYLKEIVMQFQWLRFNDSLSIDFGIVLDPISVMMLVVISLISTMVHIYSLNYMHGEERFQAYYAYLSLFTFSMLGLVISINLFQMYIFWELVGISSFLLIGFYFTKPSAVAAAKKAFIVTRFADLGFLIGILMLSFDAKTLNIFTLIERLTQPGSAYISGLNAITFLGLSGISWALLLVFIGGAGKSAMFPLHIWLPDAMEGPTPVSALIHAATMVVAGVYMVARLFPVLAVSAPDVLTIISYIGVFSALFAALIACTQTDIKRVLAYSTISQIGFMMFAIGLARWGEGHNEGFTASMFHLFTHAFFKALLFLCAGVIIHGIHSNEIAEMGGLRKKLPITHITFLLACLSISGIPPLAGFFSKESILSSAFSENRFIFYVALFTSGLTSFYMFRLYFRIFWNIPEKVDKENSNLEKGQWAMLSTLLILSAGAIFAGFVPFGNFVSSDGTPLQNHIHFLFSILPVSVGLAGIIFAGFMYFRKNSLPETIAFTLGKSYRWSYDKFYIDEIYYFMTKKVLFNLVGRPAAWFDRNIVDGMMNGTADLTLIFSKSIKKLQSGRLQGYTMWFMAGILTISIIIIYKLLY